MGMLGQMGDMYKLQKEAKRIKKELAQTHVSAEASGVKVIVNGEQQLLSIEFIDESLMQDTKKLEKAIVEAMNRAMKKAQEVAAERMKPLMGSMGMGGGQ